MYRLDVFHRNTRPTSTGIDGRLQQNKLVGGKKVSDYLVCRLKYGLFMVDYVVDHG
jgi:hypothetical protein